jgi:hypothetical protein
MSPDPAHAPVAEPPAASPSAAAPDASIAACGVAAGPAGCGADAPERNLWDPPTAPVPHQTRPAIPGSPRLRRLIGGLLGIALGLIKAVAATIAISSGRQPLGGIDLDALDAAGGAVMVAAALGLLRGHRVIAYGLPAIFILCRLRHIPDRDLGTWIIVTALLTAALIWGANGTAPARRPRALPG